MKNEQVWELKGERKSGRESEWEQYQITKPPLS